MPRPSSTSPVPSTTSVRARPRSRRPRPRPRPQGSRLRQHPELAVVVVAAEVMVEAEAEVPPQARPRKPGPSEHRNPMPSRRVRPETIQATTTTATVEVTTKTSPTESVGGDTRLSNQPVSPAHCRSVRRSWTKSRFQTCPRMRQSTKLGFRRNQRHLVGRSRPRCSSRLGLRGRGQEFHLCHVRRSRHGGILGPEVYVSTGQICPWFRQGEARGLDDEGQQGVPRATPGRAGPA